MLHIVTIVLVTLTTFGQIEDMVLKKSITIKFISDFSSLSVNRNIELVVLYE